MSDQIIPPQLPVEPVRQSILERVSIVWIIPLIALLIALGVAWQSYQSRGPVIEIAFENASGVVANETELRYRDVAVGVVERVTFTESLDKVLVRVRVDRDVAPYVDEDAQFWVVRPKISTEGIEGLDTVLTGVFIEGLWNTKPGNAPARFDGLSEAPLSRDGRDGLRIVLRAVDDTGLTENAPIVYRGIDVGRIGRAQVSADGTTVEAEAIIFKPHDRLISTATRFWESSGFTFNLGPSGAEIDFSSLASLISGGISFSTVVSGGGVVTPGTVFSVYTDEGAARASVFAEGDGAPLNLTAVFADNVAGLTVDSPVDLGGVRVGRVTSVNGLVDPERFGDRQVRLAATLAIRPGRLGLPSGEASPEAALEFLDKQVRDGLRARLVTASILTGGLKVELLMVEDAEPALLDQTGSPNPVVPTTESEIADVSATAEGLFERINALPIEDLMNAAIGALDNVSRFVAGDDLRKVPGDLRALLGDARGLIGSEAAQALPGQLSATTEELRLLVTRLNEDQAATRLLAAVDAVNAAAASATAAVAGVPALVTRLEAVAAKAQSLPLNELVDEVNALARNANAVIGTEAAKAMPGAVTDSLNNLTAFLSDLRDRNVAGSAAEALVAVRDAAADLSTSVAGVPELIKKIDAVAAKAETLPLNELAADLAKLLESADALIGTDAARQLPVDLSAALASLRQVLDDLRDGGLIENANQTFASARDAADSIAAASSDLPALIRRAQAVLGQASDVLRGYDASKGIGKDAAQALREVERAAAAVGSLSRALERNPNSLLFGR
ncbi:MlaD family protein [Pseudooceanicola sp.]|uniref:MlaD family protein n=1 Tax=Pseudooceanicola sp. TaxID=1914328 RepID=UPI00262DB729|nr:MlaD family protein [Pseudooceanicola sp.]MDF1856019.1 MlaD family protein [Pseudooceanicola sp.]